MQSQDAVTEYFFKLWPWVEANKKRLLVGGGIIIAAIFIFYFLSWRHDKNESDAGQAMSMVLVSNNGGQLADAYLKVAADHPSTMAGQRAILQAAAAMFEAGRYTDAQAQFQSFLDAHSDGDFSGQAALGVAACLDAQGKSDLAVDAYQRALNNMTDAEGTGIAKLAIARIYETQGKVSDALKLYGEVASSNPGSAIGSEASMRAVEVKSKSPVAPSTTASQSAPFNLSH